MKARRLKNLRVRRVDLCARGANPEANVLLFKSAEGMSDERRAEAIRAALQYALGEPWGPSGTQWTLEATFPDRLIVRQKGEFFAYAYTIDETGRVILGERTASEVLYKATWTAAEINNLPDSSFAVIEPGGTKDDDGKTVPRSLRHLPFKGPDGNVDLPHLRNALARLPQSDLSADLKAKARARLQAAAKEAGVGESAEKADMCPKCSEPMKSGDKFCASCGAEMKKAAKAAGGDEMETAEQIKKLQDDLKAATDLADEEAKKRDAVEKSLKEQGETVAALKKRLDESEAEIKKAQDAAKLAEFKKAVDAFEHLPVKADVFAPVLKKCAEALDEAGYAELMRVLKAADEAGAGNFVEIGAGGANTTPRSAAEELNAKAEELVAKSAGKVEMPDAISQVMAQNPKLAARARKEAYSARPAES